eukprot:gene14747-16290_t
MDLDRHLKAIDKCDDFCTSIDKYDSIMANLMNKHAPLQEKHVRVNTNSPWFDAEYKSLRRERRKAERDYRRNMSSATKEAYKKKRKETTNLAKVKKPLYFINKINDSGNKLKTLFTITNTLTKQSQGQNLPSGLSDLGVANNFQTFFHEKISSIRTSFGGEREPTRDPNITYLQNSSLLEEFVPVTEEELLLIVNTKKVSCSPDDSLPPQLLKGHKELLVPVWMQLVNLSLASGSMHSLKSAIVTPLLKDQSSTIDIEQYKNYRPIPIRIQEKPFY